MTLATNMEDVYKRQRDIKGKEWRERLEKQLQRFDTPYIDVMHMHNLQLAAFQANGLGEDGCLKAARQAQKEGLIRHLAFSSHDTPENVVRLIETGEFDGVTLQYNLLDRSMEKADVYKRQLDSTQRMARSGAERIVSGHRSRACCGLHMAMRPPPTGPITTVPRPCLLYTSRCV